MIAFDSQGQPVRLGKMLAQGGEAIVYHVEGAPEQLAKLYVPAPRPEYSAKVGWMATHPPRFPNPPVPHRFVAWPTEPLANQRGRFVGYLMPHVRNAVPLLEVYSPKLRARSLPAFDLNYRYRAARHLAYIVGLLHEQGYIIGDLNESNILVTPSALVTLIDVDSFQVWRREGHRNHLHACPVGKAEYLPPELQGRRLSGQARRVEDDYFALAVLIFKLLMEGVHPFQSRWIAAGDPPVLEQKIANGWFPHDAGSHEIAARGPVAPPPHVPPLDTLHPSLAALMRRCFSAGHQRPQARPTPQEWVAALREAEQRLAPCLNEHLFATHLPRCPRCDAPRATLPRWLYRLAGQVRVGGEAALRRVGQGFRDVGRRLRQGGRAAWGRATDRARAVLTARARRIPWLRPLLAGARRAGWVGLLFVTSLLVGTFLLLGLERWQGAGDPPPPAILSLDDPPDAVPPAILPRRARVSGVAPHNLNVRSAPRLDSPILSTLVEGMEVVLLPEREGEWQRIRFPGGEGWASDEFLRPVSE